MKYETTDNILYYYFISIIYIISFINRILYLYIINIFINLMTNYK